MQSIYLSFINVHEMFYTTTHTFAWFAAPSQIMDEARITHRVSSESGRGDAGATEKLLDTA